MSDLRKWVDSIIVELQAVRAALDADDQRPIRRCVSNARKNLQASQITAVQLMRFIDGGVLTESGCWEWTKGRQTKKRRPYGVVSVNKTMWLVHRLSYTALVEPIPDNLLVRHKCHNYACFNPFHLELGTHYDNAADEQARRKGDVINLRP